MEMNFISNIILYIVLHSGRSAQKFPTLQPNHILCISKKFALSCKRKHQWNIQMNLECVTENIIYIVRNKLFKIIKTKLLTNEIESTKLIDSTFY